MTWPHWQALTSGALYMSQADVAACPTLFTRYHGWVTRAAVRHELGHALGLAHTNYRYRRAYQVMNAGLRNPAGTYQAGDRRGLRMLASRTRTLKTLIPPTGRLTGSSWQDDGSIAFTGWATLRFYRGSAVTVRLTDNGVAVTSTATQGSTADRFRLDTPWEGGTHRYCVTAVSTVNQAAVADLGCVTWHD
jgi:hypothetical protein